MALANKNDTVRNIQSENVNSNSQTANDFELSEDLFKDFQRGYAEADSETKGIIVNALLTDIASDLRRYIHNDRHIPIGFETDSIFGRFSEKILNYFIKGKGDPERYKDANHLKSMFKKVVKDVVADKITDLVRQPGGEGIDDEEKIPSEPSDFVEDIENAQTLSILCNILADAKNNRSDFGITRKDVELIELRFCGDTNLPPEERKRLTFKEIAKRFETYDKAVSRRCEQILCKLKAALDALDSKESREPLKKPILSK